jgi:hypothetical protein
MTLDIIKFVFSDFWVWCGCMLAGGAVLRFIFVCWNRFVRHLNISKSGWPPSHLDADGDWKPNEEGNKTP